MVAVDSAAVQAEEKDAIKDYCQKHNVASMVQGLVDGLLSDRPQSKPKEHFVHMLRLQLLKEAGGDANAEEDSAQAAVPGRLLASLFQATKSITSEIVPKETIHMIIQETIKLLNCDRVSLFVYDRRIDMLVLNASNLEFPIRVKPGQGIAGHVFETHETVNIPDCYADDRFDQTFDKSSGYKTNNLLTMRIVDFEGESMGVLQAINKLDGPCFTHIDEILLETLAEHASIALRNAEVYRAAIVTSERANGLLKMIQTLSQDLGAQSLILTVTMHANELVQADRCTVFLVDEKKQQLWSVSTDSGKEIRIPKTAGIVGECVKESQVIVIPDAYEDPRFNQEVDKKTGYHTKSILCVPLMRKLTNQVLAVIQMINKTEFDGKVGKFDDEDVQVMETFATFVAGKLEGSSLLDSCSATKCQDLESSALNKPESWNRLGDNVHKTPNNKRTSEAAVIEEGEEDEE
jgi:adenylate cyclase